MDMVKIGRWSFLAGIVIAVLSGFLVVPYTAAVLFVLGLIVGFLNITGKEVEKFLLAAATLLILGIASVDALAVLGTSVAGVVGTVLSSLIAFVGAAALVVAIKAVIETEKSK